MPSPEPLGIAELPVIRRLTDHGVLVVAAGGGGVPVVREPTGALRGVEAVVDKDLTASRLAITWGADMLLLLTDVPAVFDGYGAPAARPLAHATPEMLDLRTFPAGSMGPKVDAARRFVTATGARAAIGALSAAPELLAGTAGTQITPDRPGSDRAARPRMTTADEGSAPVGLAPGSPHLRADRRG